MEWSNELEMMDWSTDTADKGANTEVEKPSELNLFKVKLDYRLTATNTPISITKLKKKERQIFFKMLQDLICDGETMAMFKTNIVINRIPYLIKY